ncbi:MAG: YfaZ family outer membrane protein [Nevskiaceae bacterium]
MKQALAFLCLAVVAGSARAEQVDINLSDDTLRATYAAPLPSQRLGGIYEFGGLVGESRGLDFQQAHAGLLVTGDAGARDANVTAGLGGRLFLLGGDGADGGGLALGGMIDARLPAFNRIGVIAYAYGAPKASTFGDLEGWYEYALSLDYQVLRGASIYAGWRQVKADVENGGTYTVDTGFHAGLRLTF